LSRPSARIVQTALSSLIGDTLTVWTQAMLPVRDQLGEEFRRRFRGGVSRRRPRPSLPIVQMLLPRGCPTKQAKASRRPSGDQLGRSPGTAIALRSRKPVRSRRTTHNPSSPYGPTKETHLPSGEKAAYSAGGNVVLTRRSPPPGRSTSKIPGPELAVAEA
jgi:hypothetical protein